MKKITLMMVLFVFAVGICFAQAPAKSEPKLAYVKTLGRYPVISGGVHSIAEAVSAFRANEEKISKLLVVIYGEELGKQLAIQLFAAETLDHVQWYEREVKKGEVLQAMLYNGGWLGRFMWINNDPMQAFAFLVRREGKDYEFLVPKTCGNVCFGNSKLVDPFVPPVKPVEVETVVPRRPTSRQDSPTRESVQKLSVVRKGDRPSIKFSLGYNFSGLSVLGPCNTQSSWAFGEYLPMNSYLFGCDEGNSAWLYTPSKSFSYRAGDLVTLGVKRVMTTSYRSMPISVGLEARIVGDLWVGVNYAYSGKLQTTFTEELTQMRFNQVEYLGFYPNTMTYVWFLNLSRWQTERVTEYSYSSHELDLTARYEVRVGDRFNLVPFVGLGMTLVRRESTDQVLTTITDPWSDKVQSLSENLPFSETKRGSYLFGVAGLSAELELFKGLRLGVEASYRAVPKVLLGYKSWASEGDWSVRTDPWRITASIKVVI